MSQESRVGSVDCGQEFGTIVVGNLFPVVLEVLLPSCVFAERVELVVDVIDVLVVDVPECSIVPVRPSSMQEQEIGY